MPEIVVLCCAASSLSCWFTFGAKKPATLILPFRLGGVFELDLEEIFGPALVVISL